MAKIRIEICIISARGLPRSRSIWKLQWFAVGWIGPESKYCSRIDNSGSCNPTWRTKFAVEVEEEELDREGLVLTVEVRSREAIFLREKLQGTVSIPLREFLAKFGAYDGEGQRSEMEEVGSFQLRGSKSGDPRGFVDVSVRIRHDGAGDAPVIAGDHHSSPLPAVSRRDKTSLSMQEGPDISYPDAVQRQAPQHPSFRRRVRTSSTYPATHTHTHPPTDEPQAPFHPPTPYGQNHLEPEKDYNRRPTPPPPPPPSNTGFIPSFFSPAYAGVPPTGVSGHGGFGVGVGAGAFAAGAVLFGDDFMSGTGFPSGGELGVSTDPPF